MNIAEIKQKIIDGGDCSATEALWLAQNADCNEMCEAAHEITTVRASQAFDMCSIINAKSGRCSENCKWCAQSAHYHTGATEYGLIGKEECLHHAQYNEHSGVNRFSLVSSGRRPNKSGIAQLCETISYIKSNSNINLCVSLGLADEDDMRQLKDSGVTRYHCNMETAPSLFPKLCSTHSQQDKITTIEAARRQGLEICSGGIIGMGETMEQRVEFALMLKALNVKSIPLNLLQPIVGTPLQKEKALTADEILRTIAMFRFVHPTAFLRFAGGRVQMSETTMRQALHTGINSAIVGDLLTTIGSKVDNDKKMIKDAGYRI